MNMERKWPITPSTSVGLIVLITTLHVMENLVQSTIRIIKFLAIVLLILVRIKANSFGAKCLYKVVGFLVAATTNPPVNSSISSGGSLELSFWSIMARRTAHAAYHAFMGLADNPTAEVVGPVRKEQQQDNAQEAESDKSPMAERTSLG